MKKFNLIKATIGSLLINKVRPINIARKLKVSKQELIFGQKLH